METLLLKLKAIYQSWSENWDDEKLKEDPTFLSLIIRIGSVLFLYIILDRILMQITRLPLPAFHEPFIYFAFLKHIFTSWYLIFFLALAVFLIFFRKRVFCSWQEFPRGNSIRIFTLVVAGVLSWFFSTYDYNLYFDEGHYADRILLVLSLLLIFWRPFFIIPFLTFLLPTIGQFTAFGAFSWAMPLLPIRLLILFTSFFLIYLLIRKFPVADFVFFTGCLIAAHYWASGFAKINLTWIRSEQLYFLIPATYANGWLGFLDSATISSITYFFSYLNLPMKAFTLLVEVGCIFFFWHRRLAKAFLAGWVLFHLGIFFFSGIFFWMWIIIEIALLGLFIKKDGFSKLPIFTTNHFLLSIPLIVTGVFWCQPVKLFWFNVPVNYSYHLRAETADGQSFSLPPKFFAPFDNQFTLSGFDYLDNEKPIVGINWGAGPPDLIDLRSAEDFFAYEKSKGKPRFNKTSVQNFDSFIKIYVSNWNGRLSKDTWLSYIKSPRYIWTYPTDVESKQIKSIKIFQLTTFYHQGSYREIRRNLVREIFISK